MAESRRVQFTTLSCDAQIPSASAGPPAAPCPRSGGLQVEGKNPDRPADTGPGPGPGTVRLVLTLFEPDEQSFPEFSYSQLLEKQMNQTKAEVPLSRFEEEEKRANDEAAAIAKRLEEKYAGTTKKKDRIQDLIDIGYGYDEEDSFIDNSEAYDEFVPASLSTKFGGFYVNSGELQFRQTSDTEDGSTEEKMTEHSKKRKLNGGQDKPKKKQCQEDGDMKSEMDPSTLFGIGLAVEMKKKKKKKAASTLSVTSMLKKFQREKEKERLKVEKANQRAAAFTGPPTIPLCPADAAGGGGSGLTDPLLSLIGSTNDHALIQAANTVDFDIDLDSLLEVSEGTLSPKSAPQIFPQTADAHPAAPPPSTKTNLDPLSEQIQIPPQTTLTPHPCFPLPEGLPPGLEDSIRKLTAAAKTSEGESKLKFFTPEINSILLDIELQCREQGVQLRSKVYTHLSSFLPCSRDTLLKRVKKLLRAHMEELPRMEDPMLKLKEAIGKVMPEQIARFHETCQVYEQARTLKAAEEEKDGKQKVNSGPEDNVDDKGGKKGGPKKLFEWNEEIRECLCHVLMVKMERYKNESKGSQEMEDYLKALLENEVKPLWPKGWMQSRVLTRESRSIFGPLMSVPKIVKRPKPEKKQRSSINSPSSMTDGCGALLQSPPLKGLPQETDVIIIEGPNIPSAVLPDGVKTEVAALKKLEGKPRGAAAVVDAGSAPPAESEQPQVNVTPAPTHSLLDLLADQALAQEQPLSISQEILEAAVEKYKRSAQSWSVGSDTSSPQPPPPPPQCSPVSFPLTRVCQVVLPQLQIGDFAKHIDYGQVQIIADDVDITIQ